MSPEGRGYSVARKFCLRRVGMKCPPYMADNQVNQGSDSGHESQREGDIRSIRILFAQGGMRCPSCMALRFFIAMMNRSITILSEHKDILLFSGLL
jgi:hypothetical protein